MSYVIKVFMLVLRLLMVVSVSVLAQLLNNPESVAYDIINYRYLISNWGGGAIIQINSDGIQSYFDTTFSRIAGLHIKDNILHVASNLKPYIGVYGFDLVTDEMAFTFIELRRGIIPQPRKWCC